MPRFFVNRIDCEDEQQNDTYLERLVPKLIEMKNKGFAMPTLMIRCAGKEHNAVINSPSTVKAAKILQDNGTCLGLHIHTETDKNNNKIFSQYLEVDKIEELLKKKLKVRKSKGSKISINMDGQYIKSIEKLVDINTIKRSGMKVVLEVIITPPWSFLSLTAKEVRGV